MKDTDHLLLLKDHEIRELVNNLRVVAVKYEGTQQLRGAISRIVSETVKKAERRYEVELNQ